MILDSGPLGRVLEGDPRMLARLERWTLEGESLDVPPALRAEMYAAIGRDRTAGTRLNQVLKRFSGESTTALEGDRAGDLLSRLKPSRNGREVSVVDGLIAASAERRGAPVFTDDTGDFQRLRDESGALIGIIRV